MAALAALGQYYSDEEEEESGAGGGNGAATNAARPEEAGGHAGEGTAKRKCEEESEMSSDEDSSSADEDEECCMCESVPKYTCPGCRRRTCSLPCCKAHKEKFECTGKRPRSEFADTKTALNENTVYSDFRFLEEATRAVGQYEREKLPAVSKRKPLSVRMSKFSKAAKARGINLRIMPETFSRRLANTSYFNEKQQAILWHVELVFPRVDASITETNVSDKQTPLALLDSLLQQRPDNMALRLRLAPYAAAHRSDPAHLHVLVRIEGRPAAHPAFRLLPPSEPLSTALRGLTIVEYPTLIVALTEDLPKYPIAAAEEPSGSDAHGTKMDSGANGVAAANANAPSGTPPGVPLGAGTAGLGAGLGAGDGAVGQGGVVADEEVVLSEED